MTAPDEPCVITLDPFDHNDRTALGGGGMSCEFCPDGHEDPTRRPWAVYVHPTERDGDGQPISLMVGKTGCQHVAESDAEWLRQVIREARAGRADWARRLVAAELRQAADAIEKLPSPERGMFDRLADTAVLRGRADEWDSA